jgi:hypothetical protein
VGNESRNIARRYRIGWIFLSYWILTMAAGILLPSGDQLGAIRDAAHVLVAPLRGVTQIASRSFDPGLVEVFLAFALLTAFVLALVGCVWVPTGSEKVFPDAQSRWVIVIAAVLLLMLAIGLLFKDYSPREVAGGRIATFLYIGSSSRVGVLTILNAWFGFVQLFLFIALRAGFTTSAR